MRLAKFLPVYFAGYKSIIGLSPGLLLPVLFTVAKLQTLRISKRFFIPLAMVVFLFIQWLTLDISIENEIARLVPPLLLFSISKYIRINLSEICRVIFYMVVIDTIYRCSLHPNIFHISPFSDQIYSVKNTTSIFFFDSNLTAFYTFFSLILVKNNWTRIILLVCLYYTFSRAVYAMFLIYLILICIPEISQRSRKLLAFVSFPICIYFAGVVFEVISKDGSGNTKLLIMQKALDFLQSNWLLGIGSGEFKNDFILASHTLIGQLGELGILGITIISSPLLYYLFYSSNKVTYTITAAIVIGGIFGMYPIAYMGVFFLMLDRVEHRDL